MKYKKNDVLLTDINFIAEHKELGYKVEFNYCDLYGHDNEGIYIHSDAYRDEDRKKLPSDLDDSNFIVRIKRENEEGEIIKPIEFKSTVITSDYCMDITFSDGRCIGFDFSKLFNRGCNEILKFENYVITRRYISWGSTYELRFVDLNRFIKT